MCSTWVVFFFSASFPVFFSVSHCFLVSLFLSASAMLVYGVHSTCWQTKRNIFISLLQCWRGNRSRQYLPSVGRTKKRKNVAINLRCYELIKRNQAEKQHLYNFITRKKKKLGPKEANGRHRRNETPCIYILVYAVRIFILIMLLQRISDAMTGVKKWLTVMKENASASASHKWLWNFTLERSEWSRCARVKSGRLLRPCAKIEYHSRFEAQHMFHSISRLGQRYMNERCASRVKPNYKVVEIWMLCGVRVSVSKIGHMLLRASVWRTRRTDNEDVRNEREMPTLWLPYQFTGCSRDSEQWKIIINMEPS